MEVKRIIFCIIVLFLCFGAFAQSAVETSFRVVLHKELGTFKIVSVCKNGDTKNVLSDYNEGKTSFFAVKIGRSIYKLQNNNVDGQYTDDNGGELIYTIPRKATVKVNFEPISFNSINKYDVVKVTAKITNDSKKAENIALKAVFDTLLGEHVGKHFSTAELNSLNVDMQFDEMKRVRFISSSDGTDTINFLVYGNDITEPEFVTLGVRDMLSKNRQWTPILEKPHYFDSKAAYNDTAVCINWESKMLEPHESYDVTFYISVASDGEIAVTDMNSQLSATETGKPKVDLLPIVATEIEAALRQPKTAQLDIEYIQAILDRIGELSMDGSNTSSDEILRLNMELDMILEQLR